MATIPAPSAGTATIGHPGEACPVSTAYGTYEPGVTCPPASGFVTCAVRGDLHTVGKARRFVRATLADQSDGALVDNVAVIVSELLSNALQHGRRGSGCHPLPSSPVWLSLAYRDTTVLCAVSDPYPGTPILNKSSPLAESGRGLHIIDQLSDSWGWALARHGGKTVWATVSTAGGRERRPRTKRGPSPLPFPLPIPSTPAKHWSLSRPSHHDPKSPSGGSSITAHL
ncbi:ATP-binding protein [Streptomyces olivoreticuli]